MGLCCSLCSLCFGTEQEVSMEMFNAMANRISELEQQLEKRNVEDETFQHQLISKALIETSEDATTELGQLQEMVKSMRNAKLTIEEISKTTSEVQEFTPTMSLVKDREYFISKLSLVVFQGVFCCTIIVTPCSGDKYEVSNMVDMTNARLGSCVLVQKGDSVKFSYFEDASAYIVPINA